MSAENTYKYFAWVILQNFSYTDLRLNLGFKILVYLWRKLDNLALSLNYFKKIPEADVHVHSSPFDTYSWILYTILFCMHSVKDSYKGFMHPLQLRLFCLLSWENFLSNVAWQEKAAQAYALITEVPRDLNEVWL